MDVERIPADLTDNVSVAVEDGRGHALAGHDKQEAKIVRVGVDRIEQVVADLCTIHETNKEGDYGETGRPPATSQRPSSKNWRIY